MRAAVVVPYALMKNFTRRIEDFNCDVCGHAVQGNGYTNHCPNCLWSKHVDCMPGDRNAQCQGLMRPIRVISKHSEYIITHRCEVCSFERNQRAQEGDNFEALLAIVHGRSLYTTKG
jgi:hypothetical protein